MDNLHPQSGASPGHETGDLSISAVVKSAIVLVVLGIMTFVAAQGLMVVLGKLEGQPSMTAAEQQSRANRAAEEEKATRAVLSAEPGTQLTETEKSRIETEMHLAHTFPQPRLQYDDASDMNAMLVEEEKKLNFTGKDASGNIHIPIGQAIDALVRDGLPPVSGKFTPVNTAPTSVIVPLPENNRAGLGATKR